jgi:transposase
MKELAMEQGIRCEASATIGLDLGDVRTQVCVLDVAGVVIQRLSFATTARGLAQALRSVPEGVRVVLEVGTHSPWLSRWLTAHGYAAVVANPRQVQLIAASDRKNDRADAELLARLGRVDPQLLRPIQHRGEEVQRDRARLSVRDQLVRTRTALINQARGIAKSLGRRLPACTTGAFARRMRKDGGDDTVFPGFSTLVDLIDQISQAIEVQDHAIEQRCAQAYPETARLRQVAGVGPITALTYVLTIEDPSRFASSRAVGSYLGLRPRQRDSGRAQPQLGISKGGDPYLRRTLVQAAHYILGRFGPDTELRRFGLRLIARGGRGAGKKARVAVARKLAVLLHRLWVSGEAYEPLRTESTQAAA